MPLDTTPEAAALQRSALERLTGAERLRQAIQLSEAVRHLKELGRQSRTGRSRDTSGPGKQVGGAGD